MGNICNFVFSLSIDDDSIDHPKKNPVLYCGRMHIYVSYKLMWHLLEFGSDSGTRFTFVTWSFLTLPRLDSFTGTAVQCLCNDAMDKVGCHRQKLCHDIISLFLRKAFGKILGTT